ncbi:hypothetical protein D3C84_779380 [compost metagenome]
MIWILRRLHQAISAALALTLSMQSITQSMFGVMYSAMVSRVTKSGTACTVQSGLIPRRRSAITSTLGLPTVLSSACNWRLALLTQTSSRSNSDISPTPQRAMASAAQEPTPPTPTIATWAAFRRSRPSMPYKRAMPANRGSSVLMTITPKTGAHYRAVGAQEHHCAMNGQHPRKLNRTKIRPTRSKERT